MQFYVMSNGEQQGPFTPEQIKGFLNMGHFQHKDLAWHEGLAEWKPLEQFPEFAQRAYRTPNYKGMTYTKVGSQKSRKGKSTLVASLVFVVALAAAGAGGYFGWRYYQQKKAAAAKVTADAAADAAAAAPRDNYPKTVAALNRWYAEPAAG
jgi:hypothetical protein